MDDRLVFAAVLMMGNLVTLAEAQSSCLFNTTTFTDPNLTSTDCGKLKMCVSIPSSCDLESSSCTFLSIITAGAGTFSIELQGQSSGFVAVLLSQSQANGVDFGFVSSQSNSGVCFNLIRNGTLLTTALPAGLSVIASISEDVIKCSIVSPLDPTVFTNTTPTSFFVSIATGTLNGSSLGTLHYLYASMTKLDLTNPTSGAVMQCLSAVMSLLSFTIVQLL
ncbi:uncharacterized protein LOC125740514 [Brienomyrus brachyistius]|uniref:uncharacterized protein LOC125740514 n=1 Tax=Brienomyrus brachyistius TaxID=42636 RepID=UPI0020B29F99|nr:uncharacterized protein LOC125740514 [Brienomyrus brachyistius]XP_048867724.1 uncharacterized protein LOC125740514 [Brienomyrus brachyistius]XP_048867725.1 uncharacterized protein LOC125740514 [Brienomyrus brachyistius]